MAGPADPGDVGGAPGGTLQLRLEPGLDGVDRGRIALTAFLKSLGVDGRALYRCELVYEELAVNAVRHGAGDAAAPPEVVVGARVDGSEVELVVEDTGGPFDPTTAPEPARAASIEDATVGGLGLPMVRNAARRLEYRRCADRNRVTVSIARD